MPSASKYKPFLPWTNLSPESIGEYRPDDRSGAIYQKDEQLRFATEVAIVTQRPLLLRGEPGSGKSSFAPFVARNLNWRYYEQTVTGRTEAKDLLWGFDALRRLRDAHSTKPDIDMSATRYVTPGPLWWAFNRPEALRLLAVSDSRDLESESLPREPFADLNRIRDPLRAVVLIDEIDKADPNVPNDLLEVLGTNRFRVEEAGLMISRVASELTNTQNSANQYGSLLSVITTNEERDLPAAFMRRCVVHTIREPDTVEQRTKRLVEIAMLHMNPLIVRKGNGRRMAEQIAAKCVQLRDDAKNKHRRGPSIAEFLDAVRFCMVRNLGPADEAWKILQQSVLLK